MELFIVYIGYGLDRTLLGIATSPAEAEMLVVKAYTHPDTAVLANEGHSVDGPFAPDTPYNGLGEKL